MIKRYTPGIDQPNPDLEPVAFMMEARNGECVMYADHAALIARVREIAEGMEHDESCPAFDHDPIDWDLDGNQIHVPVPKCGDKCPRGQLLEVCNG